MKFNLQAYSILEYGKRKDAQGNPHQEDSIYPLYNQSTPYDRLFIVCDGMGGHDAGEVASATVCKALSDSILSTPNVDANFTDEILEKAVSDAYAALDKVDTGAEKKMGTTLTLIKFHDNGCTIAHMGDSRVYHIRPGVDANSTKILFQTRDHSLVNDLVRIGELTPEQAKNHPQKNVITRAMQPNGKRQRVDIYHTADILQGDYFYLCTDGMLEQMEDRDIAAHFAISAGDDAMKVRSLLQDTANNKDNHSAYIIHIWGVEGIARPLSNAPVIESQLPLNRTNNNSDEMHKKTLRLLLGLIIATIVVALGAFCSFSILTKCKSIKERTERQVDSDSYNADTPSSDDIEDVEDVEAVEDED